MGHQQQRHNRGAGIVANAVGTVAIIGSQETIVIHGSTETIASVLGVTIVSIVAESLLLLLLLYQQVGRYIGQNLLVRVLVIRLREMIRCTSSRRRQPHRIL